MEIHELNTYSGTLGNENYFPTDNGSDTSKISWTALAAPLNARIDNIIAGGDAPSAAEVTDARLGADGITYSSLGTAIRTQVSNLQNGLADVDYNYAFKDSNYLKVRNIDNGKYWDNTNGSKATGGNYSCTHDLIMVDPDVVGGQFLVSENEHNMFITCFNSSKQLFDHFTLYGKTSREGSSAIPSRTIPQGTYYIGLSVQNEIDAQEISVRMLDNVSIIEYPYDDPNTIYLKNKWRASSGAYQSVNNLDCVFIAGVKEGDKYYTNASGQVTLQFFDGINAAPLTAQVENVANGGRIFTAPANTTSAVLNILHSKYHGSASQYSTVAYKLTKGESVLAIGDSITWLDDRSGYDGATLFLGWQKQVSAMGYKIVDCGYSGYTYAKDVMDGDTPVGSIYNEVVVNNYDVSGYDYVVLAGGTNDDLYAVTVGTVTNEYQHVYTNAELKTTVGALGAIIDYIRQNNPTCKIIVCTQNKSQSTQRPYSEAVQYADGIRETAKFASCYLCDLFENMNVQPYTNSFAEFYYDSTHPNKAGMVRMGQLILKAIENA